VPPPRIRPTLALTPTRTVAIARPQGRLQHARNIVFVVVGCVVRLLGLRPVIPPQPIVPAHGRNREPTDTRQRGTGRVGLAPALSSGVPPRRTRWRLPHLGYLGDEESRSKILDNQGMYRGSSRHMIQSWWWCFVASTGPWLVRQSHSLALLGLTPGAGASRFGAAPAGLLSSLVCSLPISIKQYTAYVAYRCLGLRRVLLRQRTGMPASSLPFLLYKTLEVGRRGMGSLIYCLWYLFDGSASPVYMAFLLPRCRLDMLLPLLCTCHPSFCHCKKYCVVFGC
jgi:hypothetical protein